MAMIFCPQCGKQISDKAAACPQCGTKPPQISVEQTPVQQVSVQQQVTKKSNKTAIVIGAIASVIIIALVIVIVMLSTPPQNDSGFIGTVSSNASNNNYVPPVESNNNNTSSEKRLYNVNIEVECRENIAANKYDFDILVDGKNFATMAHGAKETFAFLLEEGSHSIEFRIASKDIFGKDIYKKEDKNSYQIKTFNVSKNMNLSYYVKFTAFNNISVEVK